MGAAKVIPIQASGRFFWKGDCRFLIKGVVYRLHDQDRGGPLDNDRLDDLRRDITLFKGLGLNVLFVESIDPTGCYDAGMQLLADAGIYVLVALPTSAKTTNGAGTTTTFRPYSPKLVEDCFATIDCVSKYNNTLGVVIANGALSNIYSTAAAPMIKTLIREVKGYMATAQEFHGRRRLPIGYSASNSRLMLKSTFNYFAAGGESEGVDYFCYANFNWCGESTMLISGYDAEVSTFSNTQIPVFFSQYGCHLDTTGSRIFQEASVIYSPKMVTVFSGGIAYEFYDSAEPQSHHYGYGLVKKEETPVGKGVTILPDYYNLKARLEVAAAAAIQPGSALQPEPEGPKQQDVTDNGAVTIPALAPDWKTAYALPFSV